MSDRISYNEYKLLMNKIAYWIISNNRKIKMRDVYNFNNKGYKLASVKNAILKDKGKTNLIWGRRFVELAVLDNSSYEQFPNYVTANDGTKYYVGNNLMVYHYEI